jgi:hypothetical protein
VHRWLRLLPADQLARVGEQLARDAALDADLIRVWRRARS